MFTLFALFGFNFLYWFFVWKEVSLDQSNITQTILNTINYIFETLLSSIDNRLYGILDDLTFVNSDILHDNYFSKIFGTSTTNGILLIANSLLLGILLYNKIPSNKELAINKIPFVVEVPKILEK